MVAFQRVNLKGTHCLNKNQRTKLNLNVTPKWLQRIGEGEIMKKMLSFLLFKTKIIN